MCLFLSGSVRYLSKNFLSLTIIRTETTKRLKTISQFTNECLFSYSFSSSCEGWPKLWEPINAVFNSINKPSVQGISDAYLVLHVLMARKVFSGKKANEQASGFA